MAGIVKAAAGALAAAADNAQRLQSVADQRRRRQRFSQQDRRLRH
jgi:hypothetical protein